VASDEASSAKQRCGVHTDRISVGRCQECGRPACLACAVPFRGRLLCRTCAARALGAPRPEEAVPRPSTGPDVAAGAVLAVGLLATIPPWHQAGSLSGALSAWAPSSELPVFVAVLALAGAAALTLGVALLHRPGRGPTAGAAALSAVAAGAIAFSLIRAPDFYAFTPAPFVALAAGMVAAVIGVIRIRRLANPAAGRNLVLRTRV
jgi:hypothetical protein